MSPAEQELKNELNKISPVKKAAMLLISMGVEAATPILKTMTEDEIEKVSKEIATIDNIPPEVSHYVAEEYMALTNEVTIDSSGGLNYAKKVLSSSLSEDASMPIIKRLEVTDKNVTGFQLLNSLEEKQLLDIIESEGPQTTAIILANMNDLQAAPILAQLNSDLQQQVAFRLADMEEETSPEILEDIESVLKSKIGSIFSKEEKKGGGASKVAKILENAGRSAEKNILEALEKKNPELAKEVKSYMFTFDDIATLQDIAVQKIVAEVDAKIMAIALKTTTEEMKDKVVKNMSERAAEMLQDEMQYVKDVPEKDVDDAQRKVMVALRDLQGKNEINLIAEQKTSADDQGDKEDESKVD
jgi:flagellar motor switch protein FliG